MVLADYESEFIPFPEVTVHYNDQDVPNLKQHGSTPLVDFFFTAKYNNNWRLLSELLISDDERDLERLIIGRVAANGKQLWLGRNHTDYDQWNRLFHRETYLQTTIHRPSIIEFEDDGGILPGHITGISMEDDGEVGGRTVNYGFTIGLGPTLKRAHLIPLDLLNINQGPHDLAVTARLSVQTLGENIKDSGLFAGHTTIPSESPGIQEVRQTVLGAYTNYAQTDNLVWRASVFYVANNLGLSGGIKRNESFGYAYLQPEYDLNPAWTFYGRLETSTGTSNDIYVQQIPAFISERSLIGTRYQLQNNQVIKFELAKVDQYGKRFVSTEMQWSAALP